MKVLSLFSGIGGFEIACEWAGMEIIGQVEIDPFCQKVLAKHWPHVKRMGDIKQVRGDEFGAVDIIVGGVPCQPASVAGKRRGTEDDRWLWPETLRIVKTVRPKWCVFENPSGILSLQGGVSFDNILSEMEREGYEVRAYSIPACAVGAPHKRERVFIVAYTEKSESPVGRTLSCEQEQVQPGRRGGEANMAYTDLLHGQQCGAAGRVGRKGEPNQGDGRREGSAQSCLGQFTHGFPAGMDGNWPAGWWPTPKSGQCGMTARTSGRPIEKSTHLTTQVYLAENWPAGPGEQHEWEPPRIATGVKDRVSKLKALGNAVVPQQVYPILKAIYEIELNQSLVKE